MILSSVNLLNKSAYSWLVISNNNKQILRIKTHLFKFIYNFNMSEPLFSRTNFILALNNKYPFFSQDSISLYTSFKIHIRDCCMPFLSAFIISITISFISVRISFCYTTMRSRSSFLTIFFSIKPLIMKELINRFCCLLIH